MRTAHKFFLSPGSDLKTSLQPYVEAVLATFAKTQGFSTKPYSGLMPQDLHDMIAGLPEPQGQAQTLADIFDSTLLPIIEHSINPSHPLAVAHLHCPPALLSSAIDLVVSALNQSMDSWDQASAASEMEQKVISWLLSQVGYADQADGVFTSGGTMSNQMGLLLAREHAAKQLGHAVMDGGMNDSMQNFRILCSDKAHFSVAQAASLFGFGRQAVLAIATNDDMEIEIAALEEMLQKLRAENLRPLMVVATAGTTAYGSIDPLTKIAALCREYNCWFHVDAAYGFALLFSQQQRHKLAGLELADSISCDFHKMFYQPISCGAFLVRDRSQLDPLLTQADYLDRESDRELGYCNLVGKSLQTSRRFDGLKLWLFLQHVGLDTFAVWIEHSINLNQEAAAMAQSYNFKLAVAKPQLSTLTFRVYPAKSGPSVTEELVDQLQIQIRLTLLHEGFALLGQTQHAGRTYLKITLLNPLTTSDHIKTLLKTIKERSETLWLH